MPAQPRAISVSPGEVTSTLEHARVAFRRFLAHAPQSRDLVVPDLDADGLSAGVLLEEALTRLGRAPVSRLLPDRGRNIWTSKAQARLAAAAPGHLYVLDLGVRTVPPLPGVSTCFIDHHALDGRPRESLVISSYHWRPSPNTSLLVWQLCNPLVALDDRDWLAAVGALGDLTAIADFPLLRRLMTRYGAPVLREVVSLVNAARRTSVELAEEAARLLAASASPRELLAAPGAETLREARRAVQAALQAAKHVAPVVAGRVAVIQIRTPYQLHPLLAQLWRTRLKDRIVVVGNEDYLPGRVNFAVRGPENVNVREFLAQLPFDPGEDEYARGHDAASGGSLTRARWPAFLRALGLPEQRRKTCSTDSGAARSEHAGIRRKPLRSRPEPGPWIL